MRRAVVIAVLILVVGCKKKEGGSSVDAPSDGDQLLAEAGEEAWKLCGVVRKVPDTPAAAKALEKVKAIHARVAPSIKRRRRAPLEGIF